jgi:hypothetical protein
VKQDLLVTYRLEVDQEAVLEEVIDNLMDELGTNKELTDWVVEFAKENLENERPWDVAQQPHRFRFRKSLERIQGHRDDVLRSTSQRKVLPRPPQGPCRRKRIPSPYR